MSSYLARELRRLACIFTMPIYTTIYALAGIRIAFITISRSLQTVLPQRMRLPGMGSPATSARDATNGIQEDPLFYANRMQQRIDEIFAQTEISRVSIRYPRTLMDEKH